MVYGLGLGMSGAATRSAAQQADRDRELRRQAMLQQQMKEIGDQFNQYRDDQDVVQSLMDPSYQPKTKQGAMARMHVQQTQQQQAMDAQREASENERSQGYLDLARQNAQTGRESAAYTRQRQTEADRVDAEERARQQNGQQDALRMALLSRGMGVQGQEIDRATAGPMWNMRDIQTLDKPIPRTPQGLGVLHGAEKSDEERRRWDLERGDKVARENRLANPQPRPMSVEEKAKIRAEINKITHGASLSMAQAMKIASDQLTAAYESKAIKDAPTPEMTVALARELVNLQRESGAGAPFDYLQEAQSMGWEGR